MDVRTIPLTVSEFGYLIKVLSGEELELIIAQQDPDWLADMYDLLETDQFTDLANGMNGGEE